MSKGLVPSPPSQAEPDLLPKTRPRVQPKILEVVWPEPAPAALLTAERSAPRGRVRAPHCKHDRGSGLHKNPASPPEVLHVGAGAGPTIGGRGRGRNGQAFGGRGRRRGGRTEAGGRGGAGQTGRLLAGPRAGLGKGRQLVAGPGRGWGRGGAGPGPGRGRLPRSQSQNRSVLSHGGDLAGVTASVQPWDANDG